MELILTRAIQTELVRALKKGGAREIGGVRMGEQVEDAPFRVVRITVQAEGRGLAWFTRSLRVVVAPLRAFFKRTNHEYGRFNYLGEWHSHPMFTLTPSRTDGNTTQALVSDPSVNARFAALLLVRLGPDDALQAAATPL